MVAVSKIIFIVIAVVVTIMASVVIATSLGTQDDVPEAADPQPTHTTSETLGTVNGTPGTLTEPQDSASQTTVVGNGTSGTLTEPQDSASQTTDVVNEASATLTEPQDSASQTTEPPTQSEELRVVDTVMDKDMTKSNLPKVVDVGLLISSTGELISTDNYDIMTSFGQRDFNNYLEEIGAPWRMNLVWEDTRNDPVVALEKIQVLNSKGIKFVLGPKTTDEIHHIKSYADSSDMVLISPSSASPSLAVADNIFRMVPNDTYQGKVLALLFQEKGIKAVIPIYRGDVWGDGIYETAKNGFEALGGVMDEGVRYSPDVTVYSTEATLLSSLVDEYVNEYSADKVAVLMAGFSETVHLLGSADPFDNLHDVRWFGSDGSLNDITLSDDPVAWAFLQDVNFTSTAFDTSRNDVYAHLQERFMEMIQRTPHVYDFPIYDSIWVLGKTILETDSIDPLTVRDAITDVASRHTGAIGTINLNEFGDFATPSYDLWSIRDGQWYVSGHFDADSGTFSFT